MIIDEIRREIFNNADEKYRDFQSALIPNIDKDKMIGVRTPVLRKMAKRLSKNPEIDLFLSALPHEYFEENNLHGFILSEKKDFNAVIPLLDRFLGFVDNWATCDQTCSNAFKNGDIILLKKIYEWIDSGETYKVRFGVKTAMGFFLGEGFDPALAKRISAIESREYYINMAVAWYFATALAKNYEETVGFIENGTLSVWTHNKAIQKATESFRVFNERKAYLKTLKK